MWRTAMCRDFVKNSSSRKAMERPARPGDGTAAILCCGCTTEGLLHVLKNSKKLCVIGIACVCAAIVGSARSDVLHLVEADTNVKVQQRPSFALGAEAPWRGAGNKQPIPKKFSHHVVPSTEKKTAQRSAILQGKPLAEHRRFVTSQLKQVGGEAETGVLPRDEYEQGGPSIEFERGEERTEDTSDVYGVVHAKKNLPSPSHSSIAGRTSLPASTEQSSTAAEFPGETGVQLGKSSRGEDQPENFKVANPPHHEFATLYGTVHASDVNESVLEESVPVDSPLSGPLEELYIPGYTEAYDTNVHPDGNGDLNVFAEKTDKKKKQDEPPMATGEAAYRAHDAGHEELSDTTLNGQLPWTNQLHRPGLDGVLEVSGQDLEPVRPHSRITTTSFHSQQMPAHTEDDSFTNETKGNEKEWATAGNPNVTIPYLPLKYDVEQPQSHVTDKMFARLHPTLQHGVEEGTSAAVKAAYLPYFPTEEHDAGDLPPLVTANKTPAVSLFPPQNGTANTLPRKQTSSTTAHLIAEPFADSEDFSTATSNYSSDNHTKHHTTAQQTSRESRSGNLRNAADQDGQLRDLPSTQEQEQRLLLQMHRATATVPTTVLTDTGKVKQDSVDIWTADDTGGFEEGEPHTDSPMHDDSLVFPKTVATDHLIQMTRSDDKRPAGVKDVFTTAPEKRLMPFAASTNQQGSTGREDGESGVEIDPSFAADSEPELAGQGRLPVFEENIELSSIPRRAGPEVQAPTAEEAPVEGESTTEEGIVEQETQHEPQAPLEEEAVVPEETKEETTSSLPEHPAVPENVIGTSPVELPPEHSSETHVMADPREGACSSEELTALTEYFSNQSESCAAYRCIDEAGAEFLEKLQEHYGTVYEPTQQEELAGLFAACYCRCPMMKCEVDYVMDRGSPSCKAATVDYCESSNEKFVQRCTSAAQQLPLLYDLRLDTAGFKVPCRVCRQEDTDADATGTGPIPGGAEEELPSSLKDDNRTSAPRSHSSASGLNSAPAGSTPAAEGLLEQRNQEPAHEGDYGIGEEEEEEDSDSDLEEEEEYDEELPFLQLEQHVSTMPSSSSSSAIHDSTAEEMEGVSLPESEEQGLAAERESDSQGDTQESPHLSTPTAPPLEGGVETESTMDDQLQRPPSVEGDGEEGAEAPVDGVIIQSRACRQALTSAALAICVVTSLFIASLPI